MSSDRVLKLAFTGTAAGLFSGLFGVGGGTVIVPLLVLWLGYDERTATGTSLAAIVVIAVIGARSPRARTATSSSGKGLLVGVPAVGGVLARDAGSSSGCATETIVAAVRVLLVGGGRRPGAVVILADRCWAPPRAWSAACSASAAGSCSCPR